MRDVTRFVPAAAFGLGCLLISGVRAQKVLPPVMPISKIAVDVNGYHARDTVVSAAEQKVAGMSDYVLRLFGRDQADPGFSIYVGYYDHQVQGKSIHSPKNCLPGAGWEQLSASVEPVSAGDRSFGVNRYLLANKGAQALVLYWYQGRGRVEANEYKVKLNLLHDAARYGRTEEALVRIVVPIDARNVTEAERTVLVARADSLARTVASSLIPAVQRVLPTSPSAS